MYCVPVWWSEKKDRLMTLWSNFYVRSTADSGPTIPSAKKTGWSHNLKILMIIGAQIGDKCPRLQHGRSRTNFLAKRQWI